jgi:plasmid stabilization system protein ParE
VIVLYTNRSRNDLETSFRWYENQRRGLGFDFLDCIECSIVKIMEFPELYNYCFSNFRRCVIRRFPFSIFYTVENDKIIIHSVFNNWMDPEKRV